MGMVVNGTYANFDGIYAGASLGYMNQSTSIDAKQNPANEFAHISKVKSQRGAPLTEIFVGWGKVFGKYFYGGLEGQVDWALRKNQKMAEDTGFIFKSGRKGLGIAALIRLGYLVTPTTLVYGAVGLKTLRSDHDLFEKAEKISAPFSQRTTNLLTEVGVETAVGLSSPLRFRFAYGFMPKKSMVRTTTQFPVDHVYHDHGIFKTSGAETMVKMSIIYRF